MKMTEEKVYKLKNGKEKILVARTIYQDKRYLLLVDNETEEYDIAYEEDNKLVYLKKEDSNYSNLLMLLYDKIEEQ